MKPFTNRLVLALATILLAACGSKEKVTTAEEYPVADSAATAPAPLSESQKKEGWKTLFDGKSLAGWRTYLNKENGSWEVVDGTLHSKPFDSRKSTEHVDLMTNNDFENFELSVDWKIAPKANSGIMYRVSEEFREPFLTGPEYQIVDDGGYGELKPTNTTGGVYDMYVPANKTLHPVGQWNTSRIVVSGNHVEHWLNGSILVSYDLGTDDWKKRKASSKWNDAAEYGQRRKGHIDLQDHGDEVWFRNILVRVL